MDQDKLEVVPQAVLDELNELYEDEYFGFYHFMIDVIERPIKSDYPATRKWVERNHYTDELFLKINKHIAGEPQFKAEKPKKWIVRTKETDDDGEYWCLIKNPWGFYDMAGVDFQDAHKFDTKDEAEEWINPQHEAVEVEE
ncbi:hypothetical protein D3P96_02865 [Weissella viridescens]|uniref:DUF1642 domain-containing protein n=1 Tax=Weissella viridescens TaxID=1629 RepID=A0A3P2RF47_WEIVI|nr:hypothetical protein [Weissella viridescens]RRG18246.1 hypothetical protein D3P96_02865 [Weissella viridescens]